MDIAYNLPFSFSFLDSNGRSIGMTFTRNETDIYLDEYPSCKIKEQTNLSYFFHTSEDADAVLYLEAFDIIPNYNLIADDGRYYCKPMAMPKTFFSINPEEQYDILRVDSFPVEVHYNGETYYSMVEITPKHFNQTEWNIMRDDLEAEIRGLAQDYVRRNIGLGTQKSRIIPPEQLYHFMILHKYSGKVFQALKSIKDSPKYKIITNHVQVSESKARVMDAVTVREHLMHEQAASLYVPVKEISYDIQENRLLKNMIQQYDKELTAFIVSLEESISQHHTSRSKKVNEPLYETMLNDYMEAAYKLKRITGVIKGENWYKSVGRLTDGRIPHSFVLDSRYQIFFKMSQELKANSFQISFDRAYTYAWKQSSQLYEMWCYIKLCRALMERYSYESELMEIEYDKEFLFPFLKAGTRMTFLSDKIRLEVIYDPDLPSSPENADREHSPVYVIGTKRSPDIIVHVYEKESDIFLGSIILECKYRKLNSIWYETSANSFNSTKQQLVAYSRQVESNILCGKTKEVLEFFRMLTVMKVFVLNPDLLSDRQRVPIADDKIVTVTMRPDTEDSYTNDLMQRMDTEIDALLRRHESLKLIAK